MQYFVFRINYEEQYFQMLKDELVTKGKLRQGWGAKGMTILQAREDFISAWYDIWGDEGTEKKYIIGKWNTLQIINDMHEGDLIIIPKLSLSDGDQWNSFTIARRTAEPYAFSLISDDFGHIVPVEPIVSFTYSHNHASRIVSAKFKAYQRPINRVYAADFCDAVDQLLEEFYKSPTTCRSDDMSPLEALIAPVAQSKQACLKQIVAQINKWQPYQLEKIIEELFVKNGYTKLANNRYDRLGGDIDLVFDSFVSNTFMADIFSFSQNTHMPEIRIQAKNKRDIDAGDIEGVEQLIKMEGHESSINILINTTEEFSDGAKNLAAEKGVILINGTDFASLLVKYGLDVLG